MQVQHDKRGGRRRRCRTKKTAFRGESRYVSYPHGCNGSCRISFDCRADCPCRNGANRLQRHRRLHTEASEEGAKQGRSQGCPRKEKRRTEGSGKERRSEERRVGK